MKALVTGATGFIGGNVVKALLDCGYEVRALVRGTSNLKNIPRLPDIELAFGDLRDRNSLEKALVGCDFLFHVAAAYTFWAPEPRLIYATNVYGTANILEAARDAGVKKIVYTSTETTIGISNGDLGREEFWVEPNHLAGAYKRSKYQAEQVVWQMYQTGLPVVIVNPTAPVGDVKPTPTGQMIVDFLNGRMPAYVNTGLNLVDVEDVALGHVLALEKGRIGQRYILGNKNLMFREILEILAQITGLKAPRFRIPIWLANGAAYLDEFVVAKVAKRPPRIPVDGVKTARTFRYHDCSKAVQELSLPQTPVEEALEKAVRWFRQNGYASRNSILIEETNFENHIQHA